MHPDTAIVCCNAHTHTHIMLDTQEVSVQVHCAQNDHNWCTAAQTTKPDKHPFSVECNFCRPTSCYKADPLHGTRKCFHTHARMPKPSVNASGQQPNVCSNSHTSKSWPSTDPETCLRSPQTLAPSGAAGNVCDRTSTGLGDMLPGGPASVSARMRCTIDWSNANPT